MKCISLWQPWATLMIMGIKHIETRTWSPGIYRGPLLIHAAKHQSRKQIELCQQDPFNRYIQDFSALPFGAIIGKVILFDVVPTKEVSTSYMSILEYALGDFSPGRAAWLTREAQAFTPIPYRGQQGLFDVDFELLECEIITLQDSQE